MGIMHPPDRVSVNNREVRELNASIRVKGLTANQVVIASGRMKRREHGKAQGTPDGWMRVRPFYRAVAGATYPEVNFVSILNFQLSQGGWWLDVYRLCPLYRAVVCVT